MFDQEENGRISISDTEFTKLYECPICEKLYKDCVWIICGHRFCKKCINEYAEDQALVCPVCKKIYKDTYTDSLTNKLLTNYINRRKIAEDKKRVSMRGCMKMFECERDSIIAALKDELMDIENRMNELTEEKDGMIKRMSINMQNKDEMVAKINDSLKENLANLQELHTQIYDKICDEVDAKVANFKNFKKVLYGLLE